MSKKEKCTDPWILCTTGAYLVLAGPGTGKTYSIIHRIENLVKNEKVKPSDILCLTFSNAAANEMLKRLKEDVAVEGVNVFTFHGLCLDIIEKHKEKFNPSKGYSLINDALKNDIMRSCLLERDPEYWKTEAGDSFYHIDELIRIIPQLKRNRLTKEQYFESIEENPDFGLALTDARALFDVKQTKTAKGNVEKIEKRIGKAKEAWTYYEMYCSKMKENNLIDFDDCILLVVDLLEKEPAFAKEIASQYKYLIVDEYQDTNKSQNELVIRLGKLMGNVYAVGDDDQMIYRFQGADISSITNYKTAFADSLQTFCLQNNYRSSQNILDVAEVMAEEASDSRVINSASFSKDNISKKLTSKEKGLPNKKININIYSKILEERKGIVNDIKSIIESDECPKNKEKEKDYSEIAVIVRENEEAAKYAKLLSNEKITCEVKKGMNLFEVKGVHLLLCYLKALASQKRYSGSVYYLLHSAPFSLCPKDFYYLWQKDKENGKKGNLIEILENGLKDGSIKEKEKVEKIVSTYRELWSSIKYQSISKLIDDVGNKTGIYDQYKKSNDSDATFAGFELLKNISVGFSSFYKKQDLFSFLAYLQRLQDNNVELPIEIPKTEATANAVQVITYHGSKGREFSYVFMPNLTNKGYEDKRANQPVIPLTEYGCGGKDGIKASERVDNVKLFFVGMTRARHTLNISYSLKDEKDKETKLSELFTNVQNVTDKVETIDKTAETYSNIDDTEENPVKELFDWDGDYKELTIKYLEGISNYSATNLNTYIACPAKYYLERVIRLQDQGDTSALGYGSSIHAACEFLVKEALVNKKYPSYEDFNSVFVDEIKKRFFDENQKNELLKKGKEKLPNFYDYLVSRPVENLFAAEKQYEPVFEDKPFITKIDRIEKDSNGNYQIYDYKTGKPKDSDKICWEGENEDYFRQLGMYSYVLQNEGLNVTETGFIFPDATEASSRDFCLKYTEDDINKIVEDYKTAIKDINSMKFPQCKNDKIGSETCKFCSYRALICNREKKKF